MITEPLVGLLDTFVAVDPSIDSPGAAVFELGKLVDVFRVRSNPSESPLARAAGVARLINARVPVRLAAVVVERPQHDKRTTRVPPDDLIKLAASAGAIAAGIRAGRVVEVTPREWIGTVSKTRTKPWESPRGLLILSCLDLPERELTDGTGPDEMDAIGIGLAALARLVVRRRRTRPGDPPLR